ncbi:MAG: hypothetical protein R2705_19435 [Ilumatobacteraceae bacterium]
MVPFSRGICPAIKPSTCSRPDPVIPAMPTTSPGETSKSTPCTLPPSSPRILRIGEAPSNTSVALVVST